MATTHTSPCDGWWYPAETARLNALLDELFEESIERTGPSILPGAIGLVVPHAAPLYSGAVAASAYRHLHEAQPRRVFVLGFSHRMLRSGVAIPELERYRTPAGDVVVDVAAARRLLERPPFHFVSESEICDHSIEIQLPFVRRAAPGAPVVPLCVGRLTGAERAEAAAWLAEVRQPGDVLLASSDMAHYGRDFAFEPFPPDERAPARLRSIDLRSIEAASSIDGGWFLLEVGDAGGAPCGRGPIALLLDTLGFIAGEEIYQEELDYDTSGALTSDFSTSVGYAALGYFPRSSFELGERERNALLTSAAATLEHLRATGRREAVPPPEDPELARRAGVFVTLRGPEGLVGCLGRLAGLPLRQTVPELALAAACDDPRNDRPGVVPPGTIVEISVLTPMRRIPGPDRIRIGVDGARIDCGVRQGILLPQVARPGWTADDFVRCLCRKAGLRAGSPPPDARLFRFRAQVLSTGSLTSAAPA